MRPKIDYETFRNNVEEIDVQGVNNLSDFILAIDGAKRDATKRPQALRNPKFIPKPYWNDEIRNLHKQKKSALIKYYRQMSTTNLIEFQRLHAIFKRKLKRARFDSWKQWAESLSPRTAIKDIFNKFKRLSNYRVPNQPNVMFQNLEMVEKYLNKLCKVDVPSSHFETTTSNTEAPLTMDELNFVLAQKGDSAPGMDGIKYGDIARFLPSLKETFLELVNERVF